MRISLDIRRVVLRGSTRIVIDVTDETTGRTVNLPPQPVDLAFDGLQVTLLDMVETNRDSGMTPALKAGAEPPTALIRKPKQ